MTDHPIPDDPLPNPGRFVSQADFARLRGVSRQAVSNMVRRGTLAGAVLRDGRIDTDAATQLMGPPLQRAELGAWDAPAAAMAAEPDLPAEGTYADFRTRREAALAKVAEIEAARRGGEIVMRSSVAEAGEAVYARLVARILALPAALAFDLAGITDPDQIEARLSAEMRQAFSGIHAEFLAEADRLTAG